MHTALWEREEANTYHYIKLYYVYRFEIQVITSLLNFQIWSEIKNSTSESVIRIVTCVVFTFLKNEIAKHRVFDTFIVTAHQNISQWSCLAARRSAYATFLYNVYISRLPWWFSRGATEVAQVEAGKWWSKPRDDALFSETWKRATRCKCDSLEVSDVIIPHENSTLIALLGSPDDL